MEILLCFLCLLLLNFFSVLSLVRARKSGKKYSELICVFWLGMLCLAASVKRGIGRESLR